MMAEVIDYVDGMSKTTSEIKHLVSTTSVPLVFTSMIDNWSASKWSLDEFTKLFGDLVTQFKLYHRTSSSSVRNKRCKREAHSRNNLPVMETDCFYVNASFKEFFEWIKSADSTLDGKSCELSKYPYENFWCYADYKYMAELFSAYPSALTAVDWSSFGLLERNGFDSTIWVSSDEARTPCHQDTYGTNLVAQIHGRKRWILYPPSEGLHLKPSRIPYEESSIFSQADPSCANTSCKSYQVDLKPGDVLFVPKHWWHYVESLTPSISINTWLEHETDPYDRVKESLVNLLVYSVKTTEGSPISRWLNPTQDLSPSFESCFELVHNAVNANLGSDFSKDVFDTNFLLNCFTDNEVLEKVIEVIGRNMKMQEI